MSRSESIKELAAALSKAQGQMKDAIKDSDNPFFKSKYADLSSVWDACRKALSDNGLSVIQNPLMAKVGETESFCLETTLFHESGEYMSGLYPIKPVKDDPQGHGSAITYARRYALAGIVGVAQADDDGNNGAHPEITKQVINDVIRKSLKAIDDKNKDDLDDVWSKFDADEQAFLWGKFDAKQRAAMKKLKSQKVSSEDIEKEEKEISKYVDDSIKQLDLIPTAAAIDRVLSKSTETIISRYGSINKDHKTAVKKLKDAAVARIKSLNKPKGN